jgi:hypothetical protein
MTLANSLTIKHDDDTVTKYTDVRYTLTREGVRVIAADGDEKVHTDVADLQAYKAADQVAA